MTQLQASALIGIAGFIAVQIFRIGCELYAIRKWLTAPKSKGVE